MSTDQLRHILHVEDNAGDVLMTREAFGIAGIEASISVVTNGEEAIDFLKHRRQFAQAPPPDLVVLDLNLPVRSGLEVLDDIGHDPELHDAVVAVLTSSPTDTAVCSRYGDLACRYFQKSSTFEGLVDVARQIHEFWRLSRQ